MAKIKNLSDPPAPVRPSTSSPTSADRAAELSEEEHKRDTAKRLSETKPATATMQAPMQVTHTTQLVLPKYLQQSSMPEVMNSEIGGYIGFSSTQSAKWNEQQNAGLVDGQPYLFHQQRYIGLKTLDFFLLLADSFQSLMVGKEGTFKFVTRDLSIEGPSVGSNRTQPHYVGLLLVHVIDRYVPIKGDFVGTKSGGMESAIRAVEAAGDPNWLKLSDAHKVTAVFPQPFGRVFHRVTTKYAVSKTSGNPYYRANCQSNPATPSQMQSLYDSFANPEFVAAVDEAKKNYDLRIKFLDDIAAKSTQGPIVGNNVPAKV